TVDFHDGLAAFANHRRVMDMADLNIYSARLAISGSYQGLYCRFEFFRSDREIDVPHHAVRRRYRIAVEKPRGALEQRRPQPSTCQNRAKVEALLANTRVAGSVPDVQKREVVPNVLR